MKKILVFAFFALACLSAQAVTYYFSDCQAGAGAGCQLGNDDPRNLGTSPDSPRRGLPSGALVNSLVAGDQVLLARNGSWRSATTVFYTGNTKGRASNPIVIADYSPAGYAGTAKPLITITGPDANCLTLITNGTVPAHKEGFTFKNIKCVGPGAAGAFSGTGIFTYNDVSDVLLENLDISGFSIGVNPDGGNQGATTARLTLRNSFIHDNGAQGFLGGGPNLLVEGNVFDNNGFDENKPLNRNHNIYLSGSDSPPYSLNTAVVRGNTLTRSAVCGERTRGGPCGTFGECQGVSLVVHNSSSNIVIENNVIDETSGATGGCYGIEVAPSGERDKMQNYAGTVIRGNRIVNVGSNGIKIGSCPYCVVEDNVVVWTKPHAYTVLGISTSDWRATELGNALSTNLTVRNNSVYIAGNDPDARGIVMQASGTGHRLVNNLVFLAADASPKAACFDTTGLVRANFDAFDYNLCYSNRPDHALVYSQAFATLASAQAAGFDEHGRGVDPLITVPTPGNGYSMSLASANSPARNAGHPTLSKVLGYRGAKNPNPTPFIGAYPYSPTITAPSSPRPM